RPMCPSASSDGRTGNPCVPRVGAASGAYVRPATSGPQPFRAEHVGSLLRPQELRGAFKARREGRLDQAGFRAVEDACIRAAIAMQERVGLRVVTDGEFRRASYWAHWIDAIEGLEVGEAGFRFRGSAGDEVPFAAPQVTGPLRRLGPISGHEYEFSAR